MKEELTNIILPEGNFRTKVLFFDESDRELLYRLYREWLSLSKHLREIKSRGVNIPEGISEGAFCLETGAVRIINSIPKANTSFDCYNLKNHVRIQVKGCSVIPDLTSFGPKSVWDKIYFLDFFRDGSWDGKFDIYEIDNNDIYCRQVNASQTLKQQQQQKRRPRFSIYKDIIRPRHLQPIMTGDLHK
jgi:hypothetical protein